MTACAFLCRALRLRSTSAFQFAAWGLFVAALAAAPAFAGSPEANDAAGALRQADPHQQAHLQMLGVPAWHDRGYRGQGLKIAVIDSGFRGYRTFQGKGLPTEITARTFRRDRNFEARDSQHGILCAEVIHAIVPDAEILIANWEPHQPESFLDAVRWAKSHGAQIVTCSCIMPNWSDGEGGGAIHEKLAGITGAGTNLGDVLFFSCTGNTANRHWSGTLRPDSDGYEQWAPAQIDNPLSPWGSEEVSVELYCKTGATYEIRVLDRAANNALVARSTSDCSADHCSAAARFHPQPGADYVVRVRALAGKPGPFHVTTLQADLSVTAGLGSVCFPGDGKYVMAVGAVDGKGTRCSYSARGPNSPLLKPDLVAPVPFPSHLRTKPFSGTSAATPQAAAMAALLWSSHPDWRADMIRATLVKNARDLGPPGHDWETGYGLVALPAFAAPRTETRLSAYPSGR